MFILVKIQDYVLEVTLNLIFINHCSLCSKGTNVDVDRGLFLT